MLHVMCRTCSPYIIYETRNNKSGKGRKSKVAGKLFADRRYDKPPRKITFTNRREEDFERDGVKGIRIL